jgi:hypothetical protein
MSNILQEVDDAMRRERMEKLWKEYGHYVLGLIAFIVLATAVHSGWNAWNNSVQSKQTEQLMALLSDSKFPENIKPEELNMRAPLRGIALMNAAGAYTRSNKNDEALKLYGAAAEDSSIPDDIRHLAILMEARLLAAQENPAKNPVDVLKPVTGDSASAWQPYALLEAAAITADKNKDYTAAREYLKELQETEKLPQSLYAKARALDELYAVKQGENQKTDGKS